MKIYFLSFWWLVACFVFPAPAFSFSPNDLKKIILRYSQNKGIKMRFKKKSYLKLLKKTKKSDGEILISKGSFVLKVKDHLNTRILFDGKSLWHIVSPVGEKAQINKVNLSGAEQNKLLLSFLFSPDKLFQKFRFVSSHAKGRTWILNFEPIGKNSEVKSFSLQVDGNLILKTWFKWKNSGNEEEYIFSNIRFNQNISRKIFQARFFKPAILSP